MNIIRELFNNRKLIWKLAKNDFKTKYAGSYFGILWAFVQPIVTIMIYVFVFQFGFKAAPITGYPYVLLLISGIVPWFFFAESLVNATNCLLEYSYLVKKVVFKISILPIVKVVSSLFVHIFFVAFTFIVFVVLGKRPSWTIIQVIYYTVCTVCLSIGCSFFTCAIVPFFRDFANIINIFTQLGMWMCPIMWNMDMLANHPLIIKLVKLNPVYYIVQGYRDSFMQGPFFWLHWKMGIYFWIVTIMILFLGFITFKKLRVHFSDVL